MLPKMLLIVVLVSCVSAELVQLNKDNIPKELKDVVTVEDGKMVAECSDSRDCKFNFMASFSSEKLFNFFFEKKCPEMTVVTLHGSSGLIPEIDQPNSNFIIYANGTLLLNGNAQTSFWPAGIETDPLNVTVKLSPKCQFKLTEGTVLVPSVATSNDGTSGGKTSNSGGDTLIYILGGGFGVALLGDIALAVVLWLCISKQKKKVADAEAALSVKPGISEVSAVTSKQVDVTATTKRSTRDPCPSARVAKDESKSVLLPKTKEEIAALALFKNDKLKTFFEHHEGVAYVSTLAEVEYFAHQSAKGVRMVPLDCINLANITYAWFCTFIEGGYYNCDPKLPILTDQEVAKKVVENRKKFDEMGPPKISSIAVYDIMAVDTYSNYLFSIFVVSRDVWEEMNKMLPTWFIVKFDLSTLEFLAANDDSAYVKWLVCKKDTQKKFADNGHFKNARESLEKYLRGASNGTYMERLMWYYHWYGSEYVDKIPLKDHVFSRLPLQGLLLLLFRKDISEPMAKKILSWFKVVSFGILRKKDHGSLNNQIAFPFYLTVKLWYTFDFSKFEVQEIERIRKLLDAEDPPADKDWECM